MLEKRWITPKEAANYLSLHLKTVYVKISKGEIPASRIGGSIRVDKKKLDELMENNELEGSIERWGI